MSYTKELLVNSRLKSFEFIKAVPDKGKQGSKMYLDFQKYCYTTCYKEVEAIYS